MAKITTIEIFTNKNYEQMVSNNIKKELIFEIKHLSYSECLKTYANKHINENIANLKDQIKSPGKIFFS